MTYTCNQCDKELTGSFELVFKKDVVDNRLFWCQNPACPNFSLLQVPKELIPKQDEPDSSPN